MHLDGRLHTNLMISIKRWSASNVTWWVQLEDLGHPQNWSNVKLNWIKLFMILQRLLMMVTDNDFVCTIDCKYVVAK